MLDRRKFLRSSFALGALAPPVAASDKNSSAPAAATITLCGDWLFRADADAVGEQQKWQSKSLDAGGWSVVRVPHTWQVAEHLAEHHAPAWYRRTFDAPAEWTNAAVRIEFEAVFHSARVWINGEFAGEHLRKGYTAFTLDISRFLRLGQPNTVAVRVDNSFDEQMLPRGRSSDWAHDGGIYRPVQLLVTPALYLERIDIDALPDLSGAPSNIEISAILRNTAAGSAKGTLALRVVDEDTGLIVLNLAGAASFAIDPAQTQAVNLKASLPNAKLWHFDHPHLYRAEVAIEQDARVVHQIDSTFGFRRFEVRGTSFYFNGEPIRLMGVERMAGSNPEFGMAEPAAWITHDHDDLKNLNCVFTRVHWQQDRRVLDYCDRHGILLQTEVPTWGPDTFKNMGPQCDPALMENGHQQLREMIARDRNHPSIVAWGLCNEIGGQNAPAYDFAKNMLAEAKRIDPRRLCSYASHSLFKTPGKDVAALMDFVEFNEYYGSWQSGGPDDLSKTLDQIAVEIPGKPIVISEYGYCACTADRPEGDQHRIDTLRTHDQVFREKPYIAGLIFFCYNDYRTHIGDRGAGATRQRVHGVVDLYGRRKPSYEVLRSESSPVESVKINGDSNGLEVVVRSRKTIPSYHLAGYRLRAISYGQGDIPIERREVAIKDLAPGESASIRLTLDRSAPLRIQFDVLRPTDASAYTIDWKPQTRSS